MGPISSNVAKALFIAIAGILVAGATASAKKADKPKTGFEISDVKLYTLPAKPVCGEPVRLVTEIHATKPGKVDFTLLRRVGRSQKASLTIAGDGEELVQRWIKEFTYKSSVKREYMVVVKGHEYSTGWVPVEVNCEARASENANIAQN